MHQTSSQIHLFNLHDSPVSCIKIDGEAIRLELDFSCLGKGHASNPFEKAQTIKPCHLLFQGVKDQQVQVWSESRRTFEPHPFPSNPIENEIIEFEVTQLPNETKIKLTGFHRAGWVEWHFTCKSVLVSWSEFSGNAWYES